MFFLKYEHQINLIKNVFCDLYFLALRVGWCHMRNLCHWIPVTGRKIGKKCSPLYRQICLRGSRALLKIHLKFFVLKCML